MQVWPDENFHPSSVAAVGTAPEAILGTIQSLSPQNDEQRALKSQALATGTSLAQARWLLAAQATESSIPIPFLVILVFWPCVIFASFGLYAPANVTVVATLGVCALSIAGAIFLILELAMPFARRHSRVERTVPQRSRLSRAIRREEDRLSADGGSARPPGSSRTETQSSARTATSR